MTQQQHLIRMKNHVVSDFSLCVGISNPDPSNNWSQKMVEVWTEHGRIEKLDVSVPEFQFV